MGVANRARLLAGYLLGHSALKGRPVELTVETTGRCNLRCPMCPREMTPQPNRDMSDDVYARVLDEARRGVEAAMLVGLGEPLLDRKIFDRIEACAAGHVSVTLSTNGTLLGEDECRRLLASGVDNVILSFDGATKATYEHYRAGARFEQVRDNFVRLARMKHETGATTRLTVQMILMNGTRAEADAMARFWREIPGIDEVRLKEDETRLESPDEGPPPASARRCHYLWRGPMYVKADGTVHPCHQSDALGGPPAGNLRAQTLDEIWNGPVMRDMRRQHAAGRRADVDVCRRCRAPIPHPALVGASLLVHAKTVRRLIAPVERAAYFARLPVRLLRPARPEKSRR